MACQSFPPSPFQVCGAILDKYLQTGGPNGFLLHPKTNELANPDGFGRRSEFLGGNIYWSPDTGAHPVAHEFLTKWGEYGYEGGFIGYPTTDEIVLSDGVGRRQEFQGATIYWAPLRGAHNIQGAIRTKWEESGAERGPLGYPTSDEVVAPDGMGRFNRFDRGMIYWSPSAGAHSVTGRILEVWAGAGYERSQYGYPIGDAVPASEPGAVLQQFERGSIFVHNDYLRALLVPAQGFASYDTGLHPAYCPDPLNSPPTCPVDLSDYDTVPDPFGTLVPANLQKAAVVSSYFSANDRPNAHELWENYYKNAGSDYVLNASILDVWTAEDRTAYKDPNVKPPAERINANKEEAIQAAIAETNRTGQPAKVIISSPWLPVAGISNDHVQSVGRYSLCCTTAVIAQPGNPGQHQIQLRTQAHMYDVYDFAAGDDYGNPAQQAVLVGVEGEKLGIAKPFLVLGSASVWAWTGVR
ncbi:LGFP repeat-containing protein [Nocardia sp. CS682]|uniref:LGFP repeat-containing protein n=1 Tax=Nocardia sp. CS682 TaxID=1047172 RepID=UPI0010753660|nr:LGFP repeat-containing protein [Nocardia sp. CS682]QBS44845.1 hypothetical protein DMB37_36990 [Nocardia sp. CS682]